MAQQIDLDVNPSDETIRVGPLTVRFLLGGIFRQGKVQDCIGIPMPKRVSCSPAKWRCSPMGKS
jgi:hypothetical protein